MTRPSKGRYSAEDACAGEAALRSYLRREGHAFIPRQHIENGFPLGDWVRIQRWREQHGSLPDDQRRALDAVPGWLWRSPGPALRRTYLAARAYARRTGNLRVPPGHREDDVDLHRALAYIQTRRAAGRISLEAEQLFASVPGWQWVEQPTVATTYQRRTLRRRRRGFDRLLPLLQAFSAREGHTIIPRDHVEAGARLGHWVRWLRDAYPDELAPAERELLEAVPGWRWAVPYFDAGLLALHRFASRFGHLTVVRGYKENSLNLYAWIQTQRTAYRRALLEPHQIALLESVPGWSWSPPVDVWELGLHYLQRYIRREGHAAVPKRHEEEGYLLGVWVSKRRGERRTGNLTAERITLLDSLPGWRWEISRQEAAAHLRGGRRRRPQGTVAS